MLCRSKPSLSMTLQRQRPKNVNQLQDAAEEVDEEEAGAGDEEPLVDEAAAGQEDLLAGNESLCM